MFLICVNRFRAQFLLTRKIVAYSCCLGALKKPIAFPFPASQSDSEYKLISCHHLHLRFHLELLSRVREPFCLGKLANEGNLKRTSVF